MTCKKAYSRIQREKTTSLFSTAMIVFLQVSELRKIEFCSQEICFEWEKDNAARRSLGHKVLITLFIPSGFGSRLLKSFLQLGHILKLSKNNVTAIYLATKRFSDFKCIDFSATPEVITGDIN